MTTVPITLNDTHESFIQQALKSGRYVSESEVIADALSEFQVRHAKFVDLQKKIQVGLEQAERGEFVEFTAEDIKTAGRYRIPVAAK